MKKLLGLIVIVLIIVGIIWYSKAPSSTPSTDAGTSVTSSSTTPSAPVSETTKVSSQTTEYQNAELGFSIKYPSTWEKIESDLGVSFIMPIDKKQVLTVAKLQADVFVMSSKCAFPPVTTIKDRGTLKVGIDTLNTISMSNTVQGRSYFNRMYSLQKGPLCYAFTFSSITLDPTTKYKGSDLTQAQNNNKATTNSADSAFTDMVKSFAFVVGPAGVDETKAPKK